MTGFTLFDPSDRVIVLSFATTTLPELHLRLFDLLGLCFFRLGLVKHQFFKVEPRLQVLLQTLFALRTILRHGYLVAPILEIKWAHPVRLLLLFLSTLGHFTQRCLYEKLLKLESFLVFEKLELLLTMITPFLHYVENFAVRTAPHRLFWLNYGLVKSLRFLVVGFWLHDTKIGLGIWGLRLHLL